ncbi:MAG: TiaS agmantine-binding domain-containing protein, partial [Thermoplasmata archaeon]
IRAMTRGSRRGIVGAASAIAWPGRHPTWELIAYRERSRWGTPRPPIAPAAVARLEARFPELFLCRDPRTRRVLIAPHTACPIRFGLRASRPDRLVRAARGLTGEPTERWLTFRTNQGTGDHLARRPASTLSAFRSGVVVGVVARTPEARRGGHVTFELEDRSGGPLACIAFEPTKTLPRIARSLRPGDRVLVWGGRGADPTFRLEGIRVIRLAPRWAPGPNPRCPTCGGGTKSRGSGRGFRCPRDHHALPPEVRGRSSPDPAPRPGWFHPTPSARRHLAPRPVSGVGAGPGAVRWWLRRPRMDLYD